MNITTIQPHALEILKERYLLKDTDGNVVETPAEMLRRVADFIYSDDAQQADIIYDLMYNLKFLPNSPTLTGAGTPLKMLSACFVLPIEDSLDSILQTLSHTGNIHKLGGGTGFNFNKLRPKGDLISSTKGPSSGPVSFMTIFNTMTEVIKQGSIRRGANIGLLDMSHPDIIEFITSKLSGNKLNNFNISVTISNKFMDAVLNNKPWDLTYNNKVYDTVQAVDLFNLIVECAWRSGDPGIVFIDTVNAANTIPYMPLEHVNPCVVGDTIVNTIYGRIPFKDLVGTDTYVFSWDFENNKIVVAPATNFRRTKRQVHVYTVMLNNGSKLTTDLDHNYIRRNGDLVQLRNLKIGDALMPFNSRTNQDGYLEVWNNIDIKAPTPKQGYENWMKVHHMVLESQGIKLDPDLVVHHKDFSISNNDPENLQVMTPEEHTNCHRTRRLLTRHKIGQGREYTTKKLEITPETLPAHIDQNKLTFAISLMQKLKKDNKLLYKEYKILSKKHNAYSISSIEAIFGCWSNFKEYVNLYNHSVVEIVDAGFQDVYNCFVPHYHNLAYNSSVFTMQCSEQPLFAGEYNSQIVAESCNLGSINLSKFVNINKFQWEELEKTVDISVKFLDRVIDKNEYPFDFIDKGTKLTRKIGLGIMGLADALIMLGIPYDSLAATNFMENVMQAIQTTAHKTSTELGSTLGTYPLAESIHDLKRNNQILTVAPTGTLSIIAGCSSGIEPIFAPVYTRRTLDREYSKIIHPLFEKILINEGLYSEELIDKISKKSSIQDIEEIPIHIRRLILTSHDILPIDHILMQAACQKYTDNAISKTINLPEQATLDDVKTAFMEAYLRNCKSVTVYRDKSKPEQVLYTTADGTEYDYSGLVEIPENTAALRKEYQSGCSSIYIKLLKDIDHIFSECWIDSDGTGGCVSLLDSIAITISICLRFTPMEQRAQLAIKLAKHLQRIQCHSAMRNTHSNVKSCGHAIGLALLEGNQSFIDNPTANSVDPDICECGTRIQRLGKCTICPGCGATRCN